MRILFAASLMLLLATQAFADMQNTRIALHRKDRFIATKAIPYPCDDLSTSTIEPNYSPNYDHIPCTEYTTTAPLGASTVYIVVGQAGPEGVGAVSFGIDYDGRFNQQTGIDPQFVSFQMCASGVFFPNDGGFGEFPAPKGGIRITWNTFQNCPSEAIGSHGVHAVVGALYAYAYSSDLLRLTPNNNLGTVGPELAVHDCAGVLTDLLALDPPVPVDSLLGRVQFGPGTGGFTPCFAVPCTVEVAAMNVDPNTIKTNSGPQDVTVYIELPSGFDPAQVHLGTVTLNGVSASPSFFQIGDFNHNHISDFGVKFPRNQLVAVLPVGDQVPVTATGIVSDCTFTGTTTVRVTGGQNAVFVSSGVPMGGEAVPNLFRLHQNAPNPFQHSTRVGFDLPGPAKVGLKVFDLNGRTVRILADAWYPAGNHELDWDARDISGHLVAGGIYFLHLQAGAFTDTKRMYLQR